MCACMCVCMHVCVCARACMCLCTEMSYYKLYHNTSSYVRGVQQLPDQPGARGPPTCTAARGFWAPCLLFLPEIFAKCSFFVPCCAQCSWAAYANILKEGRKGGREEGREGGRRRHGGEGGRKYSRKYHRCETVPAWYVNVYELTFTADNAPPITHTHTHAPTHTHTRAHTHTRTHTHTHTHTHPDDIGGNSIDMRVEGSGGGPRVLQRLNMLLDRRHSVCEVLREAVIHLLKP